MRKAFGIALVFGLICWTRADAGDAERFRSQVLYAYGWAVDEHNIETGFFLSAGHYYQKTSPGEGSRDTGVYFWFYQYDGNIGEYIRDGSGQKDLVRGELEIDPQLRHATLNTTATADGIGGPVTLSIQLEYTGTGDLVRVLENRHFHFPGSALARLRYQGLQREAEISGSITGPGITLPLPQFGTLLDANTFQLNYEE